MTDFPAGLRPGPGPGPRAPCAGPRRGSHFPIAGPTLAQATKPGEPPRGVPSGCGTLTASGASWNVCDSATTSNNQPAGGSCASGATGAGATIDDATAFSRGDAFDFGGMFWINNTPVGGVGTYTATSAVFAAQSIAGLSTQLRYDALASEPTLRTYLRLTNPGASAVTVTVDYATNFGSDGSTVVNGSSSGDTAFTTADRWLVSSDGGPSDPVNTTVIYSGTPAIAPSAVSGTVFDCAATNGARATYSVTVPAGQTVALVTFQRLGDQIAASVTAAAAFTDIQAGSPLLAGLSAGDVAAIRNIGVGGGQPPAAPAAIPVGGGTWTWLLAGLLAIAGLAVGLRFARR
jgi:hypothetical protein